MAYSVPSIRGMLLEELFAAHGGLLTTAQLRSVVCRKALASHLEAGALVRVWRGVYALEQPDTVGRLAALELATGRPIVACMGTAAELQGFDTEQDNRLHILDPGVRIRPAANLAVHQRTGAPLRRAHGRLVTTAGWTGPAQGCAAGRVGLDGGVLRRR